MGPEKYIRERARKLPLGKCYVSSHFLEEGEADVIVTRQMANGNLVVGMYLVDTYCLGVKDCVYRVDVTPEELEENLKKYQCTDEKDYVEIHNLLYGAVEFAEEAGVPPCREFASVGKYILEEDRDDIPLIEYEYGYEGKHHLVVVARRDEARWIPVLQKRLGKDFTYVVTDEQQYNDVEEAA